jgi:hypothetical protein
MHIFISFNFFLITTTITAWRLSATSTKKKAAAVPAKKKSAATPAKKNETGLVTSRMRPLHKISYDDDDSLSDEKEDSDTSVWDSEASLSLEEGSSGDDDEEENSIDDEDENSVRNYSPISKTERVPRRRLPSS